MNQKLEMVTRPNHESKKEVRNDSKRMSRAKYVP